jgi:predicted PurR-regulated permease PerM
MTEEHTTQQQLEAVFASPAWLRNLGRTCWLIVGALLVLLGLIWLVGATFTIVGPLAAGLIVAVVMAPLVDRLARRIPRAAASAVALLLIVAVAIGITLIVLAGLIDQADEIGARLSDGVDKLQSWLGSGGVDSGTATTAGDNVKNAGPQILSTLTHGIIHGIAGLASLAFGLSLAALSIFFLLKDGPVMRKWIDRHLGFPEPVAHIITEGLGRSLRGYFRGVTIVSAFNGVVVFFGALLLGVPLAGTIAVVTFVTAYIPYLGAFVAGAFAVLIALGAKGATTALIMLLIVILANGLLQNLMQPFAMGSALELNPLVVLVTTIAAGCLFGTLGLILAAPILSAAVHIPGEIRRLDAWNAPDP